MSPNEPAGSRPLPAPLSRRRLLLGAAAAAAGAALPWGAGPASASPLSKGDELTWAYQREFLRVLLSDPRVRVFGEPGKEFLYRPKQLLVLDQDAARVLAKLRGQNYDVKQGDGVGRIAVLEFRQDVDIPKTVGALRDPSQWPGAAVPQVQPNHVTVGHGNIMGNPEGPPRVAPELPYPVGSPPSGKNRTVGICDTGIWENAASRHPAWLGGHYVPDPADVDGLYWGGTTLAAEAGHGTFVAGVVRQAALGVDFDAEVALNPAGYGDELTLASALAGLGKVDIINLSLGYSSQGDVTPLLWLAFPAGQQVPVIVASAGNAGADRPVWPAAYRDVLAVAAVVPDPAASVGASRAPYSSFGSWVNACAFGERVSTYVTGTMSLPGVDPVDFDGWARWDGTSFAAPHVAGTLAKLMSDLNINAQQARAYLLRPGRPQVPQCGVLVG